MEEFIKHIKDVYQSNIISIEETFCGQTLKHNEFSFVSIDHALSNQRNEGRLIICDKCKEEVIKLIQN